MKLVPVIDFNPFDGFYLDLDGVFADFNGKFFDITGKWPHEVDKRQMWKIINSKDDFFYSLNLMSDAHLLWEYSRQFNPSFLTGLPTKQNGREQKINWVKDKFGHEWEVHVVPKKEKQLFSGPNKILIDDTQSNIDQWIEKGGHGIFHDGDVHATIARVEELRLGYKDMR